MNTMKTSASKTLLSIIALLTAGAISYAQTGNGSSTPPRLDEPGLYVQVGGGTLLPAGTNDKEDSWPGFSAAFGWRISSMHKIQVETGGYFKSSSASNWSTSSTVIPMLFSYSFCFQLGRSGRLELRATPTIGFKVNTTSTTTHTSKGDTSSSKSEVDFACGIGPGITWRVFSRLYVDAGYRYLYSPPKNGFKRDAQFVTGSVGWKF